MQLDIQTIAFISTIIFLIQVVVLYIQYMINKTNQGVRWWLAGSIFWALGVFFMPLVSTKSLIGLAMISNPLVILGQICIYIGILRFFGKKDKNRDLFSFFIVFILAYYYFMFVYNDISSRTLVLMLASSTISFFTAYQLFFHKDQSIRVSTNFVGFAFFAYGLFSFVRLMIVLFTPPIQSYFDQGIILELSFLIPIITSLFWTFGFIILLNQQLNAENLVEKEKLQLIFNTSPDAAIITRLDDGGIVEVNDGFEELSGYSYEELEKNPNLQINIWQNTLDRASFLGELRLKGKCENKEFIFQRRDGSPFNGSLSANIITIQGVAHVIGVMHDITKRKQAEGALLASEALYRSILNASPDDITITDLEGIILVQSPAATKMFDYEPSYDQFVGTDLTEYILPAERDKLRSNILRLRQGTYVGPYEYHGIRKDNSIFDIEINSGLINGADNKPEKMVFIVRDISERKQSEQRIQQLVQQLEQEKNTALQNANTDSLTGLANRRYFDKALHREFRRFKRSGNPLSLIMLDVDNFKKFNDIYGHLAGDDCLKQIGMVLTTCVGRLTDIAARFGGEEFVALLTDTDQEGAIILGERIRSGVEKLAIPHSASDIAKVVTVSLGIVTVVNGQMESPDQLVALADQAMYAAKKAGRNRLAKLD